MARKDYKAIAAKKIIRPSQQELHPSILIYGRNKKGKSTFATSGDIERTLVIDPEQGTKTMKEKDPHVWPILRWEDMNDVYHYLRLGDHPYNVIILTGLLASTICRFDII